MRNEDVEEDEDGEKEPPQQYYGCVLCGAVTLNSKVGHADKDDRTQKCEGELVKYPERFNRFVEDVQEEGLKVEHYNGRFYFKGPAVRVGEYEDKDDVIRATKVKVQQDSMGLGCIVYPR